MLGRKLMGSRGAFTGGYICKMGATIARLATNDQNCSSMRLADKNRIFSWYGFVPNSSPKIQRQTNGQAQPEPTPNQHPSTEQQFLFSSQFFCPHHPFPSIDSGKSPQPTSR
jgi:hypothetical protein